MAQCKNSLANNEETMEEGEITDDDAAVKSLSYESVSSSSLVTNPIVAKEQFSSKKSSFTIVDGIEKELLKPGATSYSQLKHHRSHKCLEKSWCRRERAAKYCSSRHVKLSKDENRALVSEKSSDSTAYKASKEKNRSENDFTSSSNNVAARCTSHDTGKRRRGSTQEKENAGDRRRSKSSDHGKDEPRKHARYQKHSLKNREESDSLCKRRLKKDKSHKHEGERNRNSKRSVNGCSESDNYNSLSRHRYPHSYNPRVSADHGRLSRHTKHQELGRKLTAHNLQQNGQMSSTYDPDRFKDNALMRKLLESGTLKKSVGSDLDCEVGSISSISSPALSMFEDIHLNDDISDCHSESEQKLINDHAAENLVSDDSDDSEIEVIIPEKLQPEVIDLKSESDLDEEKETPTDPKSSELPEKVTEECEHTTDMLSLSIEPSDNQAVESVEVELEDNEIVAEERHIQSETLEDKEENSPNREDEPPNNNNNNNNTTNEKQTEDDDVDDLQLRLVALRSAVLKKHMARIKRRSGKNSGKQSDTNSNATNSPSSVVCDIVETADNMKNTQEISLHDSIYCPSNRTSPISPTSSYDLSLCGDDNNTGLQDMELVATDEEDSYLVDSSGQKVQIEENIMNEYYNNIGDFMYPAYSSNFGVPQYAQVAYTASYQYPKALPQPLPPGVDISSVPPEFSHSLFMCPDTLPDNELNNTNLEQESLMYNKDAPPFPISETSVFQSCYVPGQFSPIPETIHSPQQGKEVLTDSTPYATQEEQYSNSSNSQKMYIDDRCNEESRSNEEIEREGAHCETTKENRKKKSNSTRNSDVGRVKLVGGIIYSPEHVPLEEKIGETIERVVTDRSKDFSDVTSETDKSDKTVSEPHFDHGLENPRVVSDAGIFQCNTNCMYNACTVQCILTETSVSQSLENNIEEDEEEILRAKLLNALVKRSPSKRTSSSLSETVAKDSTKTVAVHSPPIKIMKTTISSEFQNPVPKPATSVVRQPSTMKKKTFPIRTTKRGKTVQKNKLPPINYRLPMTLPLRKQNLMNESLQVTCGISDVRKRQVKTDTLTVNQHNNQSKFIIHVGQDSDDSGEDEDYTWTRSVSMTNSPGEISNAPPMTYPTNKSNKMSDDKMLEKQVELMLSETRKKIEAEKQGRPNSAGSLEQKEPNSDRNLEQKNSVVSQKNISSDNSRSPVNVKLKSNVHEKHLPLETSSTPAAVKLLSKIQQEEYRRLKQAIAEKGKTKRLHMVQQQKKKLSSLSGVPSPQAQVEPVFSGDDLSQQAIAEVSRDSCDVSNTNNKQLIEAETKLVNERYDVLDSLSELDHLIGRVELNSQRCTRAENEILRLRKLLEAEEQSLEEDRGELNKILKSVNMVGEKVEQGQALCSQHAKACTDLGGLVYGQSYKLPAGGDELLKRKSKDILKRKECTLNLHCAKRKVVLSNDGNVEITVNRELTAAASKDCNVNEESLPPHVDRSSQSDDVHQPLVRHEETVATKNIDSRLPDYVSPLNHLHTGSSRNVTSGGARSRDTYHQDILCPYDLAGSCQDEACPYQH